MYNPKVLLLSLNYLGIVTASLGMLFFIPQIIKSLGNFSNMTVGWMTMKDLTGSYASGLYGLALFGLVAAFISAFFLHIPDPIVSVRAPEALRAAQ
jgi:hypothetical protein